jgi:tripartite-type tricarboxylate transporter receptor subunit TctC
LVHARVSKADLFARCDTLAATPRPILDVPALALSCAAVIGFAQGNSDTGAHETSRHDRASEVGMRRSWCLAATFMALMSVPAMAQQWPVRTIRAVVPLTAGSAVDIVPRIVLEQVGAQIGQSIVVENRTGASGTIGIRSVATSPPDGYTLLAHSSGIVVSPFTVANAHYDPIKDFVAVAPLANLPNVLVVAPSQNIRTVQDFVANAKKKRITYGSAGVGTPVYLAMEKFRLAAGFQGDFIPFRGAPEVLTEVITGRVDAYYAPLSAALEFIRTGKLVALSVSSVQRSSALPDIPTSIEAGYPHSDLNFWIGIFAPAGTPRNIVARLSREIAIALADPAVREKLASQGVDPMTMGADEFQTFVNAESVSMAELAKALNLKPQ